MDKQLPITGLDDNERALIWEALRVLRQQRGAAWNKACDVAEEQGRRRPSLRAYGIEPIRQLAKRLRIGPTHWMEE